MDLSTEKGMRRAPEGEMAESIVAKSKQAKMTGRSTEQIEPGDEVEVGQHSIELVVQLKPRIVQWAVQLKQLHPRLAWQCLLCCSF